VYIKLKSIKSEFKKLYGVDALNKIYVENKLEYCDLKIKCDDKNILDKFTQMFIFMTDLYDRGIVYEELHICIDGHIRSTRERLLIFKIQQLQSLYKLSLNVVIKLPGCDLSRLPTEIIDKLLNIEPVYAIKFII
jgi:hypothetical protein